jgi:hypothetical protein
MKLTPEWRHMFAPEYSRDRTRLLHLFPSLALNITIFSILSHARISESEQWLNTMGFPSLCSTEHWAQVMYCRQRAHQVGDLLQKAEGSSQLCCNDQNTTFSLRASENWRDNYEVRDFYASDFREYLIRMKRTEIPYILESNPHYFYSFRGLKIRCGLDFECGLVLRSRAGFWKNDIAGVRAVRTIQLFIILFIILYNILKYL